MKKSLKCCFLSAPFFLLTSHASLASISFDQNQFEVVFPPTCDHTPISFPYSLDDIGFDEAQISVESDSDWAIASVNTDSNQIEISFDNKDLIASYTATVTVTHGDTTTDLFVQATVPALDIYRLVDDPVRSVTYGIATNGIGKGSILAFDPIEESFVSCLTVGRFPTDFVINDDSSELLVINSVDQSIDVIALDSFSVSETINLPEYGTWGDDGETTSNIELGPDDIIYYTDGAWGPILRVLDRSTNEVLQSITFGGGSPSNTTGFMDFAVTSDKSNLLAMPQYGWSAGSHTRQIRQFSINADGTVDIVKTSSIDDLSRYPFEAPVLLSDDDQVVFMKTVATQATDTDRILATFPKAVWSISPNGNVVATEDKLYDFETGNELYTFSSSNSGNSSSIYTKAQAFTSDYSRFIYFNESNRTIQVVNLVAEIGLEALGRTLNPSDQSVVVAMDSLTWSPLAGIDAYDVYLGTDRATVENADTSSSVYLGRVTGSSYDLLQTLTNGTEYFWRIDPVGVDGAQTGSTYSFTVSRVAIDTSEIEASTVVGHKNFSVSIELSSQTDGESWSVSSTDDWISFSQMSGTTPVTLTLTLDATELPIGLNKSSVTLSNDDGDVEIPVDFWVEPLSITHIRSDRDSSTMYAISEDTSNQASPAYLLEIDAENESIERVTTVGSSVTDVAIHYADGLLYVTNWKSGNLLAINRDTFERESTIAFQPAGATGYSQGDVYRVAAGVSQRIVVEEEDQWIDISLFNTDSEATLDEAFVREGGGAFGPGGRYYYHGENNSSGASIIKFDTSGDVFTELAEVRPPEISSYYGSRTVIVSEDGSRIFWAGAVLDEDLESEWKTGEIIYSASADGRYAFAYEAIYDINLRRQVYGMPTATRVSGFNSTTSKLVVQENSRLRYYEVSSQSSVPAPTLSVDNISSTSVALSWTDDSLEMGFAIQSQLLGETTWEDVATTEANTTSYSVNYLEAGRSYSFRVRALADEQSSSWSNVVYKQEDDIISALATMLTPVSGSIVNAPETLSWTPIPWIAEYDVYFGTSEALVASADTSSSLYMGRVTVASFELLQALVNGTEYFWRIDPVDQDVPETGTIYSFIPSRIAVDKSEIVVRTVTKHRDFEVVLALSSETDGEAWSVSGADDWISFEETSGVTPSSVNISFDASELPLGANNSSITLTNGGVDIDIPITLTVEPLNLTHIRSDRNSSTVYAISETSSNGESRAYLLEIDSTTETIKRVINVGASVTDMAIHYADDLLYVTNWAAGDLLVIDRDSLALVKTIAFQPAGATGYSQGDVYRVAAGVSQRIVVEEEDQWIDISIFDTQSESELAEAFVREGGGAFGPNGRFYYHGENNSSGASIIKYDTSGDTFTVLADVRPAEMSSYYGSRTVIVTEDGSRVFWAGAVLDADLVPEWQTGETIYSSSTDGRYAFAYESIYDVNLRRQILGMPAPTSVSGFNSTSNKLIVEQNSELAFFEISSQSGIQTSSLSISNLSDNFVELTWTDNSLEMAFVIQRRVVNTGDWVDVYTADANETSWTDFSLQAGTDYEYRIKATADNNNSPWSNVAITSDQPVAYDDQVTTVELVPQNIVVTDNDNDPGSSLDLDSVVITRDPEFGAVTVLTDGEIVYSPGSNFELTDSFEYKVSNTNGVLSTSGTVEIVYVPAPSLSFFDQDRNSLTLTWAIESPEDWVQGFEMQKREEGATEWGQSSEISASDNSTLVESLNEATIYEFRIRAVSADLQTQWSEVIKSSLAPLAEADTVLLSDMSDYRFNVTVNDSDADGQIEASSIQIVTPPQFGQVVIEGNGEVTYSPGSEFSSSDSFVYTVEDSDGVPSNQATVEVIYVPAPTVESSNPTHNSIELTWTDDTPQGQGFTFEVQRRISGESAWETVHNTSSNQTNWVATSLTSQTTYEFRVRSYAGDFYSSWSNTAAINTLAPPAPPPRPVEPSSNSSSGGGSLNLFSLLCLLAIVLVSKSKTFARRQSGSKS